MVEMLASIEGRYLTLIVCALEIIPCKNGILAMTLAAQEQVASNALWDAERSPSQKFKPAQTKRKNQ